MTVPSSSLSSSKENIKEVLVVSISLGSTCLSLAVTKYPNALYPSSSISDNFYRDPSWQG